MKTRVFSGIDRIDQADHLLKGRRVGLMTNPTGINRELQSTLDLLHRRYGLSALLACEHGVRGDRQAGEKVDTFVDPDTGVTVYSTYSQPGHRMSPEMVDAFDILVYDIQDVGVRFYTYLYSLSYAMEACARAGKPVVVLDRLNPISGKRVEGSILDLKFSSFVGDYELPTRTGLTVGEYALYIKDYLKLDLDLTVVPLTGWERGLYLDETDLPWVAPSPNCYSLASALCYIGTCVFEGVNVSEGRGTTQPFELIGAPFIHSGQLEQKINKLGLPGVAFRRTAFVPTFSKHAGSLCHGVQLHITDRDKAQAFLAGLILLETIRDMYGEHLKYLSWDGDLTYSLDRLLGTDSFRLGRQNARELDQFYAPGRAAFQDATRPYLLY